MRIVGNFKTEGNTRKVLPSELKLPTIFIECTHTFSSDLNTGIQRVVRNILRYAPAVADKRGFRVAPVILQDKKFILVDAATVLLDRARKKKSAKAELSPYSISMDDLESHANNVLLLLDSSWHMDIWPSVERFKQKGGHVGGVIYDLIPITHSYACVEYLVFAFRNWLISYLKTTDFVVAISRATKQAIENFLQSPQCIGATNRRMPISFFHLGSELDLIDDSVKPRDKIKTIFESNRPTFIMVGTIEPRKCHSFVLDAFEQLWADGMPISLIVIGKNHWKSESYLARAKAHPLKDRQYFLLRDVNDEELDFAYRNASALVIASEVEGFGLPVVEAFQRGLPVICSDIPVFREIADGQAIFFGLDDPSNLARAIKRFIEQGLTTPSKRIPLPWITWRESTAQLIDQVIAQVKVNAS